MQIFDASSIIYAWDTYPVDQFPPLWNWVASQIADGDFAISKVALDEVRHKYEECAYWLEENNINAISVGSKIIKAAAKIKQTLGIQNDKYHAKGVDENDIIIIATAKCAAEGLISDEAKQLVLPTDRTRWKVPAVCRHNTIGVECQNFLELIRDSGEIFG